MTAQKCDKYLGRVVKIRTLLLLKHSEERELCIQANGLHAAVSVSITKYIDKIKRLGR